MDNQKIKDDILKIWKHAGLDAEVDARMLAKKLNEDPDLTKAGLKAGRQLQHPQVGEKFGREGVLGAISNNVDDISLKDIADKNNVSAKKINAGLMTRIVFSILDNDSKKSLLFPVMWKPMVNYFLGKLFGDRKISKKEYADGIKGLQINESTQYGEVMTKYNIKQYLMEEGIVDHVKNNYGKYLAGAGVIGAGVLGGNLSNAVEGAELGAGYVDGRGGDLIDQAKAGVIGAYHGYETPKDVELGGYQAASDDARITTNQLDALNNKHDIISRTLAKPLNTNIAKIDSKFGYTGQ